MSDPRPKLGIIAGGGRLPVALNQRCLQSGREVYVIKLKGFADQSDAELPGDTIGIAEIGRILAALKRNGCIALCFAGYVKRPDLTALKPDLKGLTVFPGAIAAARHGDDALIRYMVSVFEAEGYAIEGADEVDRGLVLPEGLLGAVPVSDAAASDVGRAIEVARAIGAMDIGQGAVVVDGLVIALEAQEGTDAMLTRCIALPPDIRGTAQARRGVLAKCPKPIQEMRVDLPTIGVSTVEKAAAAGLAGIVGEAGRMLVMDRDGVIRAADRLGLFVLGVAAP